MPVKQVVSKLCLLCLLSLWLHGCSDRTPTTSESSEEIVTQTYQGEKSNVVENEKVLSQKKIGEPTMKMVEHQVVCDKFKLVTGIANSTLSLSVDTDLPDNAVVMVGVYRCYLQKDSPDKYFVDYFSEKSTVGKWKSEHQISVDSGEWKSTLRTKQEQMSRLGIGFDVVSISDKITVNMVVPINQPDPRFGEQNSNLAGKAVIMASEGGKTFAGEIVGPMYVVEDEIEVDYPLDSPPVGKSPFPSLDPLKLEVGQVYIVSRQTALMPYLSPADPMAAIQQMKHIPEGGVFKVLETSQKEETPWYKVVAFGHKKNQIGTGWINSTALLGQELKAYK